MTRVAIITGTGLYALGSEMGVPAHTVRVETPYGTQQVNAHGAGEDTIFHVNRHGDTHGVPPHRLDPRRTIDALARCRVDAVLSLQNTGSLRVTIPAGSLVVPHDLIDFTGHPHHTFFDDEVTHIDMTHPYCTSTRRLLLDSIRKSPWADRDVHDRGVYMATRGPRFETPAETANLAQMADIVGMTGAGEAALARERGLCYAALAFVANPAAGIGGKTLSASEIRSALAKDAPGLTRILLEAARSVARKETCDCALAPHQGRLDPVTAVE